jgi:hypothetical protein
VSGLRLMETRARRLPSARSASVDIDENTRVRLLETQPTEHRLELARGKMSAHIWAPPRLFFVNTPSAVAADLGCAYTLEVDDQGSSLLRVTSGWVALELRTVNRSCRLALRVRRDRRLVQALLTSKTAASGFRRSLKTVDFDPDAAARSARTEAMLDQARPRHTHTWHCSRVLRRRPRAVYDDGGLSTTAGVTREGVLALTKRCSTPGATPETSGWAWRVRSRLRSLLETKNGLSRR